MTRWLFVSWVSLASLAVTWAIFQETRDWFAARRRARQAVRDELSWFGIEAQLIREGFLDDLRRAGL